MNIALEEAKMAYDVGEVPVGACVVRLPEDGEPFIISRAHNLRETENQASAHAEFLTIQEASTKLGCWRLFDCVVYVTLEPCLMCAGLLYQARIKACIYGAPDPKAGALGSLYQVNEDARLNHNFQVISGVMREQCTVLLSAFFKERRQNAKYSSSQSPRKSQP
ncbi:MAG: nucleoside deaminase, partial [Eggerthellaceae bacterium]|nr:nucleoside deaminase [Eggerthellaceae bacterium]